MNESDQYISDAINKWVWSGFYRPDQVQAMIEGIPIVSVDSQFDRYPINRLW